MLLNKSIKIIIIHLLGLLFVPANNVLATKVNLCDDTFKADLMNDLGQLRNSISDSSHMNECLPSIQKALVEFDRILTEAQTNICYPKVADDLRNFEKAYISNEQIKLPNRFKATFLAFGLQVSAQCKILLLENLRKDSSNLLEDHDYNVVDLFDKHATSLVDTGSSGQLNFNEILLIKQLLPRVSRHLKEPLRLKLIVNGETKPVIDDLKQSCELKFKPIYERLILPIVGLSHLNLDYHGRSIERQLSLIRADHLIRKWFNIAVYCETLGSIVLEQTEINDKSTVTVSEISTDDTNLIEARERPLVYRPSNMNPQAGCFLIQDEDELNGLILELKDSATMLSANERQHLVDIQAKVKEASKRGHLTFMNDGLDADRAREELDEELVRMIDGIIESETNNGVDKPVSGFSKCPTRSIPPPRARAVLKAREVGGWRERTWGKFLPSRKDTFFWVMFIISAVLLAIFMG